MKYKKLGKIDNHKWLYNEKPINTRFFNIPESDFEKERFERGDCIFEEKINGNIIKWFILSFFDYDNTPFEKFGGCIRVTATPLIVDNDGKIINHYYGEVKCCIEHDSRNKVNCNYVSYEETYDNDPEKNICKCIYCGNEISEVCVERQLKDRTEELSFEQYIESL